MGLAGGSQISLSNKHLVPSPYASARTSRRVRGPFGALNPAGTQQRTDDAGLDLASDNGKADTKLHAPGFVRDRPH
jgi:hypothetical protein